MFKLDLNKRVKKTVVNPYIAAVITAAVSPVLWADSSHWYMGIGGGVGEVEVVGHDRSSQLQLALEKQGYSASSLVAGEDDGTDVAELVVGFQFSDNWGVEASYIDLGETSGHFNAEVTMPTAESLSGTVASEYLAGSMTATASYPLTEIIYLQARLGLHYWRHEQHINGSGNSLGLQQTLKDTGTDVLYGAGGGLKFNQHWDLRAQWQRYDGIEDEEGIDTKTLTLLYRF